MMRSRIATVLMVVWLVAASGGVVALANCTAALAGSTASGARGDQAPSTPGSLTPQPRSFAGYIWRIKLASSVAATTFVVPKLRCGRAAQAIAASVGVLTGKSGFSAAGLSVGCDHGKALYRPELVVNGDARSYRADVAHAGDTIVLRVVEDGKRAVVSLADKTHKFKLSRSGHGSDALSSEWAGDAGWENQHHHLEGVPDFGTLSYSHTTLGGHPDGIPPPPSAKDRHSHSATITTGPFRGGNFRTRFRRT